MSEYKKGLLGHGGGMHSIIDALCSFEEEIQTL